MIPALAALPSSAAAAAVATPAPRPNVVFVMSDDHAAHAISAYGSRVNETPNLDRLAREGMLFRNAFVTNSICTPSRAAILTGTYSHLNGVPVFNRFDGSQPTVAKLLQAAGYHTGMIGKWHLGSDPTGFDRWEILPGQGVYHDPVLYTATGREDLLRALRHRRDHRPRDRLHPRAPEGPALLPDAPPQGARTGSGRPTRSTAGCSRGGRSPSRRRCGTTTRRGRTRSARTGSGWPTTSRLAT